MREFGRYTPGRALGMSDGRLYDRNLLCRIGCSPPMVQILLMDSHVNLLIANDRFKGMEVVKGKITLNDLPGLCHFVVCKP